MGHEVLQLRVVVCLSFSQAFQQQLSGGSKQAVCERWQFPSGDNIHRDFHWLALWVLSCAGATRKFGDA